MRWTNSVVWMLPKNRDGSPKTTSPCYLCSDEVPSRSKQGRHVQGKISDPMLDFKISGMNNIRNIHPSNHQCKGFRVTFVSAHLIRYGCAAKDPVFISIFPAVSRQVCCPCYGAKAIRTGRPAIASDTPRLSASLCTNDLLKRLSPEIAVIKGI